MSRSLSLRKRILFYAIVWIVLVCITETSSFVAYRLYHAHWYTWSTAAVERRDALAKYSMLGRPTTLSRNTSRSIHPYLGFVEQPGWQGPRKHTHRFLWEELDVNQSADGFFSRQPVVQQRVPGTILVGVCGGSVAHMYYRQGIHITLNELRDRSEFRGKRFVVLCFALGGYKQPQQLMALNYILAQGGELDVLINIDGFNEVALHAVENAKKNVYPLYPRSWYFHVGQVQDARLLRLVGQSALLEEKIKTGASLFGSRPFRLSPTCHLVWRARQQSLERQHMDLIQKKANHQVKGTFDATGPSFRPHSEHELYEHLAAIWQRCALQMHALCRENDIRYFHFLQPNQYVEGSKPMSEEEQRVAVREDHPYRTGVIYGYPLLQQAGVELRSQGVEFADLTQIFSTISEQIYIDDCCHFVEHGNAIMAREIARAIAGELGDEL